MSLQIRKAAPSGNSVYAVLRRDGDEFRYIVGNGFEAYNAANLDSYDVPLTDSGGDDYAADLAFTAAAGRYVIAYYLRAGANPAADDFKLPGEDVVDWTGTDVTAAAHYAARVDLEAELGVDNTALHADLQNNVSEADVATYIESALAQADVRVNLKLGGAMPAPDEFPVVSTFAWVTNAIRTAAAKYAAGFLLNKRQRQPANPQQPSGGDQLIADGDAILDMLIAAGLPGVVDDVDADNAIDFTGGVTASVDANGCPVTPCGCASNAGGPLVTWW